MECRRMYFANAAIQRGVLRRYRAHPSGCSAHHIRNFSDFYLRYCDHRNRTKYGYDAADRLASEVWKNAAGASIYAFSHDYDLAGNRTGGTVLGENVTWAYNAAGAIIRRMDDSGTTYYSYDLDGNLGVIAAPGNLVTYFEHNGPGLVKSVKPLGGTEISFGYDAMLRRVSMTEGDLVTYFKHDGINLLEVTTSTGDIVKLIHGHTTIDGIGSVIEIEKNGTRYYIHIDHRGTIYKVTDANGDLVWSGLCDSLGRVISEIGTNPSIFWYQGQAWWKLTVNGRLYYISPARLFDVQDGRFLERDPLDKPGFENRYFYSNRMYAPGLGRFGRRDPQLGGDPLYNAYGFPGQDPVVYSDPYGLRRRLVVKFNAIQRNGMTSLDVMLPWDRDVCRLHVYVGPNGEVAKKDPIPPPLFMRGSHQLIAMDFNKVMDAVFSGEVPLHVVLDVATPKGVRDEWNTAWFSVGFAKHEKYGESWAYTLAAVAEGQPISLLRGLNKMGVVAFADFKTVVPTDKGDMFAIRATYAFKAYGRWINDMHLQMGWTYSRETFSGTSGSVAIGLVSIDEPFTGGYKRQNKISISGATPPREEVSSGGGYARNIKGAIDVYLPYAGQWFVLNSGGEIVVNGVFMGETNIGSVVKEKTVSIPLPGIPVENIWKQEAAAAAAAQQAQAAAAAQQAQAAATSPTERPHSLEEMLLQFYYSQSATPGWPEQ